jgi:hypothetical protein
VVSDLWFVPQANDILLCFKFIGDHKNHLLVGDPFAERSHRLIVVQMVCRLVQVQDRQDRQQITKTSFDYRMINK